MVRGVRPVGAGDRREAAALTVAGFEHEPTACQIVAKTCPGMIAEPSLRHAGRRFSTSLSSLGQRWIDIPHAPLTAAVIIELSNCH